jgi:hypothetical protein
MLAALLISELIRDCYLSIKLAKAFTRDHLLKAQSERCAALQYMGKGRV